MISLHSMLSLIFVVVAAIGAKAETHTVHFDNKCGHGTPTLVQGGNILSTGADFTINGPLVDAVAYLQIGVCGLNGEHCTLIETTLINPTSSGSGSGTDISLIPPHSFTVDSGFAYSNGCDGVELVCTDIDCPGAFHSPDDGHVVTVCEADNVNLNITFCG